MRRSPLSSSRFLESSDLKPAVLPVPRGSGESKRLGKWEAGSRVCSDELSGRV